MSPIKLCSTAAFSEIVKAATSLALYHKQVIMILLYDNIMLVKIQSQLSETKTSPINDHQEQLGSMDSSLFCIGEREYRKFICAHQQNFPKFQLKQMKRKQQYLKYQT